MSKPANKPEHKKTLLLKYMGLFDDPYEWCILEQCYFACNLQPNRRFICKLSFLKENTPIKRDNSLLTALERLVESGYISKSPFGKPIKIRGESELRQRYQYTIDQKTVDRTIDEVLRNSRMTPTKTEDNSYESVGKSPTNSEEKSYEIGPYSNLVRDSKNESKSQSGEKSVVEEFDSLFGKVGVEDKNIEIPPISTEMPVESPKVVGQMNDKSSSHHSESHGDTESPVLTPTGKVDVSGGMEYTRRLTRKL